MYHNNIIVDVFQRLGGLNYILENFRSVLSSKEQYFTLLVELQLSKVKIEYSSILCVSVELSQYHSVPGFPHAVLCGWQSIIMKKCFPSLQREKHHPHTIRFNKN